MLSKVFHLVWRDIRLHFAAYSAMRPAKFCLLITLEALLVSLLTALALAPFGKMSSSPIFSRSISNQIWNALVLAPIGETLLLQALPIGIAVWLGWSRSVQVLLSLIPFAALHFALLGFHVGVNTGVVAGFYLAFTYSHWVSQSLWTALWVTAVSHFLRNAFVVGYLAIDK